MKQTINFKKLKSVTLSCWCITILYAVATMVCFSAIAAETPDTDENTTESTSIDLPSADDLLAKIDKNLQFDTRKSTATMTVIDSRRTREFVMQVYGRGQDEAAVEYLEPARDRGTRMLKQGDNLWLFMPRAERVQRISGHMLRQGMMGSDISYEDMMEASDFQNMYDAVVTGSEIIDDRPCWRMEATAKDDSVTYPKRTIWVDKEYNIPYRQELYALSGMLLKTWLMTNVERIDERNVPMRMEISDKVREGSKTILETRDVSFGIELQDEIFSLRWLERR